MNSIQLSIPKHSTFYSNKINYYVDIYFIYSIQILKINIKLYIYIEYILGFVTTQLYCKVRIYIYINTTLDDNICK